MPCPNLSTCTAHLRWGAALEREGWTRAYCDREGEGCALLLGRDAGEPVPADLMPDGGLLVSIGELEESTA